MKYYRCMISSQVFAYENENDRIKFGVKDLVEMDDKEIEEHTQKFNNNAKEILEKAKTEIRLMRADVLSSVTGIGFMASVSGNSELAQEASEVAKRLLAITEDPLLNSANTYEEMLKAGMDAYAGIAKSVSPELFSAFKHLEF